MTLTLIMTLVLFQIPSQNQLAMNIGKCVVALIITIHLLTSYVAYVFGVK